VHGGGIAKNDVAAVRAGDDATGALEQLGALVVGAIEVDRDLLALAIDPALALDRAALEGGLVGVSLLERGVQGDQAEAR
jgi:hypothetical protein